MCGIAGHLSLLPASTVDYSVTSAPSLHHRGPDEQGRFVSPDGLCTLAHCRLSIIDLAGSHQPLGNEDGSVHVTFNGEIYNYRELRQQLIAAGHRFTTDGDTEVLVHGWEQWGDSLPSKLRGMFAFAIWDQRQQTLFAARDPLGKKPFYYGTHAGVLRFASELKAILADASFPRQIDREALLLYLTLGYVPDPWSILTAARKLPPGHHLVAKPGHSPIVKPYWQPGSSPSFTGTFTEAIAEFRRLFELSVRRRLIADVPLGAFLSGGIDSTVVVGTMARLLDQPVKTFTIGFDDARYDESSFARLVAKRFKTDHHELQVHPSAIEILPALAHHFDEPFADSSAIPTYYVSKLTRQHVTVALTGDGGDELFGGYRRYRVGKVADWVRRVPGSRLALSAAGALIPASVDRSSNLGRTRRLINTLNDSIADGYLEQVSQFDRATVASLLSGDVAGGTDFSLPSRWFASLYTGTQDAAGAHMRADILSYLPGDILTKVDRASMAVSLECRSPFLDVDLADFALSLPTAWRLRGLTGHKHLIHQAMADVIPPEIARRPKTGFAVPMPQWLRGPLKPMLHDLLLSPGSRSASLLNRPTVTRLLAEHDSGQQNHSNALWSLLMLEQWMRTWVG